MSTATLSHPQAAPVKAVSHTAGPWVWENYCLRPADPKPQESAVHTILECEHKGCGFICSDYHATSAESELNMALIAAAPDLLDCLKHMVRWHDQLSAQDIARAKAVIALAEGTAS